MLSTDAKLSIEQSFIFDDNIYLDPEKPKTSNILEISPKLSFLFKHKKHKFGFGLNSNIIGYSISPSANNAQHMAVDILIDLKFPVGLNFKLSNSYNDITDPPYSEQKERVRRKQNTLNLDLIYKFSRCLSVGIGGFQTLHNYDKKVYQPLLDRLETETGMTIFYHISPKTSVLLKYDLGTINYDNANNNNDSKYTQIQLGVKGKLTPKTVGMLKIGQQSREYEQFLTGKSHSGTVLSLSSLTNFTKRTILKLSTDRSFIESTYTNNVYYFCTGVSIGIDQKISSRWKVSVDGRYETNDYQEKTTEDSVTEKRKDNVTNVGLGVTYAFRKWLSLNVGHTFRSRDSNFKYYYNNNLTRLGVKLVFW